MFGLEGEGLKVLAVYAGMALGSGLLVWLLRKFSEYFDWGVKLAKPATTIVKEVVKLIIKDPTKRKEVMRWTDLLFNGILQVENKKSEMEEELEGKNKAERNKVYRETAIGIADGLAKSQGMKKPDVLTSGIIDALLEALYNFLPAIKQKEEVTVIDLEEDA